MLVSVLDVEAIYINGEWDKNIYYDPVVAASTVKPEEPTPAYKVDKSYYKDKLMQDSKINAEYLKRNCQYVHEVQHLLKDLYGKSELKMQQFYDRNVVI